MLETARLQLDGTHTVRTPEYVEFDFVLAGLVTRGVAWVIDTLLTTILAATVIAAMAVFLGALGPPLIFVTWFLVDWGALMVLEAAWSGQTVGKRALGLRVLQDTGVRLSAWQAVLRNLARPIDRLPFVYLVGGVCALLTERHQRLGDLLAGTIVVRERRLELPSTLPAPSPAADGLETTFLSRVGSLSTDEQNVYVTATLRRDEFTDEARLRLFAELAARLRDVHSVAQPAHVSDEKLVTLTAGAVVATRSAVALSLGRAGSAAPLQK